MKQEATKKRKNIMVLGGYGFIGRHVVHHLRELGHDVSVGTRKPNGRPDAIALPCHKINDVSELRLKLARFDVVINAVGILRQRVHESYDQVHHRFVACLADVCSELAIRLVHVSALGLNNPVNSRFLTSKRLGEAALKASAADWRIVRPSIIDGEGGYGAKWFRRLAAWPIHLAPANARGQLCPIHVIDLGEAIAKVALNDNSKTNQREFELGGEHKLDIFDYLTVLRGCRPWFSLRVPSFLVRLASHIFDLLHITPLSFGHYELLQFDNCPKVNRLGELLHRRPRPLGPGLAGTATDGKIGLASDFVLPNENQRRHELERLTIDLES